MRQNGLFDHSIRLHQLDNAGDPLVIIKAAIDWELFRSDIEASREAVRDREKKSNAGRKPLDAILMFKTIILQSMYNLSDQATEYQIRDRLSFMRFLDLSLSDTVPDEKTIWTFKEMLAKTGVVKKLFKRFDFHLQANGYKARKGQIVDATIVNAPKQRNSREDNKHIKETSKHPENWAKNKCRQKDVDARWTKKNKKSYFGYKNHISADVKHKFIREYDVTEASVHDSQRFEVLLGTANTSKDVWADSAYRSEASLVSLEKRGFREHIQRKGNRGRKLTKQELKGNKTRSKTRSRVEHIFGIQCMIAGNLIMRSIGKLRAAAVIGLRNLSYNIHRFSRLQQS